METLTPFRNKSYLDSTIPKNKVSSSNTQFMLQLNHIRDNKEEVIQRLAIKNFDAKEIIEKVFELDNDRRRTQNELDSLLNESNTLAKQVGDLYKQGKKAEADDLKNKSGALKESSKKLEEME